MHAINSQTNLTTLHKPEVEIVPPVARGTKQDLKEFPVKRLESERKGIQTWIIDLSAIKLPLFPRPQRKKRRRSGGDDRYLRGDL